MKGGEEPEASVVVAGEDSDDDEGGGGATPPQLTTRKPAAATATTKQQLPPLPRPRPPPPPPPPSARSPIPASLRVPPERLEALTNSGPLAPTAATLSAVAADARLVALLDDRDVMESVSRLSQSPDPELFHRELRVLSRKGKAGDLVELYRRMAAVAAKRCEAFCGEETETEREQGGEGGKGTAEEDERGSSSSPPLIAGLREREDPRQKHQQQQQRQKQPGAGIEVLR